MKLLKEIISLLIGSIPVIVLPTLLLGGITYWIEQSFGFNSVISYLWFALIWWLSLNYLKK